MIRVCHLVRQYDPCVGGLETFVANLAASLRAEDCVSEVITLDRCFTQPGRRMAREDEIDGVRILRAPMLGHRRFFLPMISRQQLTAYDVLHVHGIDGMFDRISREPRRLGQLRVATSHGAFFHTPWMRSIKELYFDSATRLAARSYDVLIGNSSADVQLLRRLGRYVQHIANGVAPIAARAHGRDLLFIGRLSAHKHVDQLIALLAEAPLADAVLHIIGPEWDVPQSQLSDCANHLGVADRVRLHGHVSAERMAEIATQCAVFVSASGYEGFGMSLIEAMSAGLIPIVSPNASFVELLSSAAIGQTADFGDRAGAAQKVAAARNNIDERQRVAAVAFARRYGWEGHAATTAALYRRFLSEAAGAHAA